MAKPLVDDGLWEILEPLIPEKRRRRLHPGRKRLEDRRVLTGILFVLRTGIPWEHLPQEMGCGSGMTCWRRLHEWQAQGVWKRLHRELLKHLRGGPDRRVAGCGRLLLPAGGGSGGKSGSNPTDRGRPGSKHHLVTDAEGTPLAAILTAANRHDVTQLLPEVDAIPPVSGRVGRPRCRPGRVYADRAYASEPHRRALRRRGIGPRLARRRTGHGSGLGVHRWVVERTFSWLHKFRRLRVRYERRDDIHEAFLSPGCALICWNRLRNPSC